LRAIRRGFVDALLTDFDRTLVWLFEDRARQREAHDDLWAVCAAHGVPWAVREAAGPDQYDLWAEAYQWMAEHTHPNEAETLDQVIASRLTLHEVDAARFVELFDGIAEILERLNGLGIPVAIVSGNATDAVWQGLKANGIEGLVVAVIGREPDFRRPDLKPSPVPLYRALAELQCGADQALYVGDDVSDMLAGRRAHVRTVGLLGHSRASAPALSAAGAECVLATFADLGSLLP
jgi:phosphoglycolate phosphatase-like HAD superfamily hydrolase